MKANDNQRYIRLTELIPQLLQMVDESELFNPAVSSSARAASAYIAMKDRQRRRCQAQAKVSNDGTG